MTSYVKWVQGTLTKKGGIDMPRRIVGFSECDSPAEVQKLAQELFDRMEAIETKNSDYNAAVESYNGDEIEGIG